MYAWTGNHASVCCRLMQFGPAPPRHQYVSALIHTVINLWLYPIILHSPACIYFCDLNNISYLCVVGRSPTYRMCTNPEFHAGAWRVGRRTGCGRDAFVPRFSYGPGFNSLKASRIFNARRWVWFYARYPRRQDFGAPIRLQNVIMT